MYSYVLLLDLRIHLYGSGECHYHYLIGITLYNHRFKVVQLDFSVVKTPEFEQESQSIKKNPGLTATRLLELPYFY